LSTTDVGSIAYLHGKGPAANRLGHGTVTYIYVFVTIYIMQYIYIRTHMIWLLNKETGFKNALDLWSDCTHMYFLSKSVATLRCRWSLHPLKHPLRSLC